MTRRDLCPWLLALALALLPAATPLAAPQMEDGEAINMSLKNAALVPVLQSFAKISGCHVEIDPDVTGAVTIELEDTPWPQALDQICTTHGLICEIHAGEPPVLRVRWAGDEEPCRPAGFAENINLSLKDARLRTLLESFGLIGSRSITIDEEVGGEVTFHVEQAPWTAVLAEICNFSGCRVEWGDGEISIQAADPGEEHLLDLALRDAERVKFLKTLGQLPLRCGGGRYQVEIDPALAGPLTLALEDVTWPELADAVCAEAGCQWRVVWGEPPVLRFTPREASADPEAAAVGLALRTRPPAGAEPIALGVRFQPPGGDPPVEGEVSFTWTRPIHVLGAAGAGWQMRLTWIPFGPELHVVLPVLIRCGSEEKAVVMLEAVTVPLTRERTVQGGGARLELRPGATRGRSESAETVDDCLLDAAATVEATLRHLDGETGGRELRTEVGAYLLVTPPVDKARPRPTAAVVALGHDPGGKRVLAVVTPTPDGTGVDVDQMVIPAGSVGERIIRAADGRELALELRVPR